MRRSIERSYETLEQIPGLSRLILRAPRTAVDLHEGVRLPNVSPLVVRYLAASVGSALWLNHLALAALLLTARRYEPSSVYGMMTILHSRFRQIASSDQAPKRLRSMKGWTWNLTAWMQQYLRGELCDDTQSTRHEFWRCYQAVARLQERWLTGLPTVVRARYRPFVLPMANQFILAPLMQPREIQQEQQRRRKEETDALLPLYPQLRSEAHLRFNRFSRLRQAYQESLREVESGAASYPRDFAYVEDGRRYHCCIWDAASFLEHLPKDRRSGIGGTPPEKFLELKEIEDISNGQKLRIDDEFWLAPLLRHVLAHTTMHNLPAASLEWLTAWGYARSSLRTPIGGVTYWRDSLFMRAAQECVSGLLIPVEQLYRALTFGLLALDLFTTTGARLNEVLQVSFDSHCLVRLTMPAPAGAHDPRPRIRYVLRLLPKGERKAQLHDYFIAEETKRLLVRTGKMLAEHYEAGERGAVPAVSFDPNHRRAHRFGVKPYVFQLYGKHLSAHAVSICFRVLVHGVVLRTQGGRTFSIRPHLLRHAFATHAVQVEKIPIDIVGHWLHQKNITTTAYYSQATETMAADAADAFLARMATHIDVEGAVTRSPPELQQIYQEAAVRSGTLVSVPGGACTSHGFCKVHFTCIGCPAKVPDPAQRDQVLQKVEWAGRQIDYYRGEGLTAEVHALEQLLRSAAGELREMDDIERYRRDALRSAAVEIPHAASPTGS